MTLLPINKNNDVEMLIIVPQTIGDNLSGIISNYLAPIWSSNATKVLVASVYTPTKGVLKKAIFEEEWEQIKEVIETYDIKYIAVAQPDYFNKILKAKKKLPFERLIGDVKEIDGIKITPILNYLAVSITPSKKRLLQRSVDTMKALLDGTYTDNREEFLKSLKIEVVKDFDRAYELLKKYSKEDKLAVDIETSGLKWYEDELLTIAFSKNETEGFCIALHEKFSSDWYKNRKLVKKFFEQYRGKVILHNAAFDIPFIVYNFWMNDITDPENMIKGVNYFDIEDTMVMAYLCLNSIERPKLSLKDLAYVKYGNWDNDIDQSKIIYYDFNNVGEYNTIDTMATMYLYNEYSKRLIEEEQNKLYNEFYKRFIPSVIKMKMNGITIDREKLEKADEELAKIYKENLEFLLSTEEVKEAVELLKKKAKIQGKRQKEIDAIQFNPKSAIHLRVLLFDVLGYTPVKLSKKTGEPATDKEVIRELLNITKEDTIEHKILIALKEIGEMKTVYSTFIKGFEENSVQNKNGDWKIFPNYNITGTLSGRMSCNTPNLLNVPSGSKYGKLVKSLIIAEKGFIVASVDSGQLEDRVLATASQDKAKMDIFLKGLDGHCIGTAAYFKEELEERGIEVDLNDVESVNKIKELAPDLRQESKPITFALAYLGTEHTLMSNIGFSEEKAKRIVKAYKELYKGVTDYVENVEDFINENGYAVGVFGLKARGDLSKIFKPKDYQDALRSLYNMTIQSSALIISRAIFIIQEWIEKNNYQSKIKITNSVYDSIYFEIVPDVDLIYEFNKIVVNAMCPEYEPLMYNYIDKNRKEIELTAELELGKSWIAEVELSNNVSKEEIKEKLDKIMKGK